MHVNKRLPPKNKPWLYVWVRFKYIKKSFLEKKTHFHRFIFDKRVYASLFLQIVPVSAYKHYSFVFVRFCKGFFEKNYKATIGVDFEMERFEVLGVPFSVQL